MAIDTDTPTQKNPTYRELQALYGSIDGLDVEARATAYADLLSILINELGDETNFNDQYELEVFFHTLADKLEGFTDSLGTVDI